MTSDVELDSTTDVRMGKSTAKGRWQLACVVLCVIALWGFVFPAIAETDFQMDRQRRIEERGIDPMALFYTDHPAAQERLLQL
ncbi:MAG: hypothetical protein ABJZ55_12595 [Fuerstiella sp.]